MKKTSKGNITSNPAVHGVALTPGEVQAILFEFATMKGDYPAVADAIRRTLNHAALSCANCAPDCMEVRVCDECRAEFYEDDGVRDEAVDHCDACERERYRQGALEAACHVPMPTDAEAAEMRRLKGME